MNQPRVQSLRHAASGTWSHLVSDDATGAGLLIDPVLDFDAASGRTGTDSAQSLLDLASVAGTRIEWILETHAHADHLSAAAWLKSRTGARTAIGTGIRDVQRHFKVVFNPWEEFATDGSQFDRLLVDRECLDAGEATPEAQFVAMRTARDATLAVPALVLPAVQVNMRAGELPPAEDNGTRYLKIPMNRGLGL